MQVDSKLTNLRTTLGALRKSRSLCSSCSSSSPPSSVSPPGWQSSASLSLSFVGHPQSPSGFFISIIHPHAHLYRHFFRLFSPRAARWRLMWCGKYLQQSQLKNLLHTLNNLLWTLKKLIVDFFDWGNLNAAIHLVFGLYPQQGVSLMIIMAY